MVIQASAVAFRRIYADISGEADAKLEAIAKANGRTKKGQIEWLINEAVAEFVVKESESTKRDNGKKKVRK